MKRSVQDMSDKNFTQEKVVSEMMAKSSDTQVRKFLKQLLAANEQTIKDFAIFLQGPNETSATMWSYKEKIAHKLDEIDLEELLQAWYCSGEDNYDYYNGYNESVYDDDTVSSIVSPFREEAKKYADNENFAESGKIFRAIIDALREKITEVVSCNSDLGDLEDWFMDEADKTLGEYYRVLLMTQDPLIKKVGLEYAVVLLEQTQCAWRQTTIEKGLHDVILKKSEAEICLHALAHTVEKTELSSAESSLLAHAYLLVGENKKFEEVSLGNMEKNSELTLPLLKFYKASNRRADMLQAAEQALNALAKESESFRYDSPHVEISIRGFLKGIFDPTREYGEMIANLEALFLKSTKLEDYKQLTIAYRTTNEKEEFLKKIKAYFTPRHDIETLFNIFKHEDKKGEILELVHKHGGSPCFPRMIAAISKTYPEECFAHYKHKINDLLREANVRIYPDVAYHLKQMKHIGLPEEWRKFVDWIKAEYSRRRRLMEELKSV